MAILTEDQKAFALARIAELDALNLASSNARSHLQGLLTAESLDVIAAATVGADWWPDQGDTWNDNRQLVIDAAEAIEAYEP